MQNISLQNCSLKHCHCLEHRTCSCFTLPGAPSPEQLFPSLGSCSHPFPSLSQPWTTFPILSHPFPSLSQDFPSLSTPFPSPSPSFSHPIPSPAALSCSKGHFHGAKSDGNGQTPQTAGAKAVAARGSVFYLSGDTSSLTDHPTPHRETSHSSSSPSDRLSQIFYSFIPLHGHSEFMSLNCHTKQPTARGVPSLAHQKTFWLLKRKFPPPH